MNRAVFLDRDGVINRTCFKKGKFRAPYTLEEFDFFPGVPEAVLQLKSQGLFVFVVTNQPDAKRGWVTKESVDLLNSHVVANLEVDALKACFHDQEDHCSCRKPKPGMLLDLAREFGINLAQSYMVGDRRSDIEAGRRAGCQCLWVSSKATEELVDSNLIMAHCESLVEAVAIILQDLSSSKS